MNLNRISKSVARVLLISGVALTGDMSWAQITPDNTLPTNSVVTPQGNIFQITGGTASGANLFHSFQEFSVPTGSTAFFNNGSDLQNIFTRVTGADVSNIDGILRANGSANLFLLNPNGIIFGPNARLDIGGSFLGTTANSIKFADGTLFKATNPHDRPLLTISVPIGLQLGEAPGSIINQSQLTRTITNSFSEEVVVPGGLQVDNGQTLALVGGDVTLEDGHLTAPSGRIEIWSVKNGELSLLAGGLQVNSSQELTELGDIQLSGTATVDVSGDKGGEIQVGAGMVSMTDVSRITSNTVSQDGGNIEIKVNEFSLQNRATVSALTTGEGVGGDINIVAAESVDLEGEREPIDFLFRAGLGIADPLEVNQGVYVGSFGLGQGGNLSINTQKFNLENQLLVASFTTDMGLGGDLEINASESVEMDGRSEVEILGRLNTLVNLSATRFIEIIDSLNTGLVTFSVGDGKAGNIRINTKNFIGRNGVVAGTATILSNGSAGSITVNASESINFNNASGIGSLTMGGGDAGNLTITTDDMILTDDIQIVTYTFGNGNAGNMNINARRLRLVDGAEITTSNNTTPFGNMGKAGILTINASESIEISIDSDILTVSRNQADAGKLEINTRRLIMRADEARDSASIATTTNGMGRGGDLIINASESIEMTGIFSDNFALTEDKIIELIGSRRATPSIATASLGSGDAGKLEINTGRLVLRNRALIIGFTSGSGNGNDVTIKASESVELSQNSSFLSNALGAGNGGELRIETPQLILDSNALISADTLGVPNVLDLFNLEGLVFAEETPPLGNAADIMIKAEEVRVLNGSRIGVATDINSLGNAGTLEIAAEKLEVAGTSPNGEVPSRLSAETTGVGNAGNLIFNTDELLVRNGGEITVSSVGGGEAGNIIIDANSISLNGGTIEAETDAGQLGDISLEADVLTMRGGSKITTNATGVGSGGNITIDSDVIAALENSDITTNAEDQGGLITINTQGRFGFQVRSRSELEKLFGTEGLTVDSPNQLPSSDISAISTVSPDLNGQVQFNDQDIDPTRGLDKLPTEVEDVGEPQQGCRVTGEPGTNSIVWTGRGLRPDPSQMLNGEAIWDDTRNPLLGRQDPGEVVKIPEPPPGNGRVIREAQDFEKAANGDIIFTAPEYTPTSSKHFLYRDGCSPRGDRSSIPRNRVSPDAIDARSVFDQKKPGFLTDALGRSKSLSTKTAAPAGQIPVKRFKFIGNTVLDSDELAAKTNDFLKKITNGDTGDTDKLLTFDQVRSVAKEVEALYIEKGYITSGAIIPPHISKNGVVTVRVVEGTFEKIEIKTSGSLNDNYIRKRLRIEPGQPVNQNHLISVLQLLQLDPLIDKISAELSAGLSPDTSMLEVIVTEAPSFTSILTFDNGRSPSVGSGRRGLTAGKTNLLGLGDRLNVGYSNTSGSDGWDVSYALPVNSSNGTISLSYSTADSEVVEAPFDRVDIGSDSRTYELTFRQPIARSVSDTKVQELALGLRASHRVSQTSLLGENFPLSAGADENGETKVSALRFFQDWTQRRDRSVLALRSEFSLGVGWLDATVNDDEPDSQFFSWRGRGVWARLLAPDTKLLVRGDIQLATGELLPIERLGIGGNGSVRGYRQDTLLADNGVFLSAELQFPILRSPRRETVVHVVPFIDMGAGWNSDGKANPDTNLLLSTGVGLQLRLNKGLTARLDWGIPLIETNGRNRTWQENGLHFSLELNPF